MANSQTKVSNSYLSSNPDFDVADDLIGSKRYQQVKLIDPTEGSTAPIGVAANPLHVTPAAGSLSNVNVTQYGGVATTLGQKAEADSIPVALATTQDTADTDSTPGSTLGTFTKLGVPWYDTGAVSEGWKPWPVVGDGLATSKPTMVAYGIDPGTGNPAQITVTTTAPNAGASLIGTRSLAYGIDSGLTTRVLQVDTSGTLAVQDNGGSLTVDGTVTANIRDAAGNALVSTTSEPDTTDRGLITKAVCHASTGGVGPTTPLVALADTPTLFDTGLVTRSIVYNTDGFAVAPASADASGRFNINSRTQDGSGNSIVSATATPGSSVRGLVTRSFAYLNDGNGVKLTAETDEFAYNAAGLGVRTVSDVFVNNSQPGALVAPHGYYVYSTRTTTTGCTTTVINTTVDPSTVCRRGDKIRITSGSHAEGIYQESVVSSVNSSSITLQYPLAVAPPTARNIYILRPMSMSVDFQGYQNVNANQAAAYQVYPVYANKFFSEGGSLAFGSISSSYATIYTTSTQTAIIVVTNATNVTVTVSFDGGATDAVTLPPLSPPFTLAAIQNGGYIDGSIDIQVKDEGVAAASGLVRATGYYF